MPKTIQRTVLLLFLALTYFCHQPTTEARSVKRWHQTSPKENHARIQTNTRRPPRTFDVQHYVIRTEFQVPHKSVNGTVSVTLKPLASGFKTFELDAASMKIDAVALESGQTLRHFLQSEKLRITLDRAYEPDESLTVVIRYRATPKRGLYFVSADRGDAYDRPAQIWTQGEPQDNRHWFPCYDFPDDKATTEQHITTASNQIAIANGTLVGTVNNANGSRTFHWRMEQPHSTYLTSLIVGDYARLTDAYKNVRLEYYTYRGTEDVVGRAFGKTPRMIELFSRKLDYEFPFDRYAQTIVANFTFGGMENITATTYADTEILTFDEYPAALTENLVAHELAHSWFGNLVTCQDWGHLWLNEGFATFFEAVFREQEDGREAYYAEMRTNQLSYFGEDPSRRRHPLVNPRYPLSMDLFDETTYKKGAWVVHMLRETVGEEVFWKALNSYLHEFKHRNVVSRDLQRVFERTSGQQLEWFFDQWVYKAGYPELRVRSSYNAVRRQLTVNVTQTQKADALTPAAFRLPLEIELVTGTGARTERVELKRREESFTFDLDGRPVLVVFDKNARALKKLDLPHRNAMAAYLLVDGADRARLFEVQDLWKRSQLPVRHDIINELMADNTNPLKKWSFQPSGQGKRCQMPDIGC